MLVSAAMTCSSSDRRFRVYEEYDAQALLEYLASVDLVVGCDVGGFDLEVLKAYGDVQGDLPRNGPVAVVGFGDACKASA